ncbi:MAG: hypothetical protein R6U17_05240, partial [Thermoplasmata archaeon]
MNDSIYEEDGFFGTVWGKLYLFLNPFLIAALFIYLLYIIVNPSGAFYIASSGISVQADPRTQDRREAPLEVLDKHICLGGVSLLVAIGTR